ncbi:TolC family protein [bacterium]|nr:TolC family protein [bacterium]
MNSILKAVVSNNGQIKEADQDIEIARQQVERSNAAMYHKGTYTLLAAPLFEQRGDAVNVTTDMSKWGPWVSSFTQVVQPLYTFGQISGYRKAAEHQLLATGELARMKRNEIVATAKDFYYTYLMAADLENLVKNLTEFLGAAVQEAEKPSKKKKSAVKPHDLNRLKVAYEDLLQKGLFATQAKQTTHKAVLWMTGGAYDSIPAKGLQREVFEKKTLQEYLELAKTHRPEFKALAAGQVARNALADAKQAQSYPTLFVGAMADLNWSPVRDRQPSWYAQDPFNRIQGGVALGLRLDLEFARHAAEASEERAQAMKLHATESYAVPGIELEVSRAYWEVEQAVQGFEIADRRRKIGRKWFIGSTMGWSVGITPAKEILEALQGDGESRQNYIQTLYLYNAALAKLSKAVGTEVTSLAY